MITRDRARELTSLEREDLILAHMRQVRHIAWRIYDRLPSNVSFEDLVSAGVVGLISAIDSYDPDQNTKLSTYAELKIRGAILDSLRGMDWAPRPRRKTAKAVEQAIGNIEQRLGRTAREEEIAEELRLPLEEYRQWLVSIQGLNLLSLDGSGEEGKGRSLLGKVAASDDDSPSRVVERQEMERLLAEAIDRMPEDERMVLSLYYQKETAPGEIAQIMNLRSARISQLKSQGIARLRSHLERRLAVRKERI